MAHKTSIGGTAYEISGGKTLIGGTGYSISGGKTLIGGTGYDVSFGPPEPLYRVGGRIFYIHSTNGIRYRFFKNNMEEIKDISISGLADAYWYWSSEKATQGTYQTNDRFFVYDNSRGLASSKTWCTSNFSTIIGFDGIGYGKGNTKRALDQSVNGTMWSWIKTVNSNGDGGCNDWYIGSVDEQNKLRISGLVTWYSSNFIWSSSELNTNYAYAWHYDVGAWNKSNNGKDAKTSSYSVCAIRSF